MSRVTTRVIAEKWGISERRVRVLCEQGRIYGVKKKGNRYLIPDTAFKPTDFRSYRNMDISQSNIGGIAKLDACRDEVYRRLQSEDREILFFLEMMTKQFA